MSCINAYIVGAQKAGTTSLYDWLAQHPDVFAPKEAKDFPLFSGDDQGFKQRMLRTRRLYSGETAQYHRVRLGAEANLVFSVDGITRLAKSVPTCRVLFLVRRPDERCFSAWRYACERGLENRSFSEAIDDEISGKVYSAASYEGRQKNYLDHSRYAAQLDMLERHFPKRSILVLPFEAMRKNPEGFVELVCEFLDLERAMTWNFRASNKTTGGSRSKVLNSILYRERESQVFALFRLMMPGPLRAQVRQWLVGWNRGPAVADWPTPAPEVMQRLRSVLADDVKLHKEICDNVGTRLRDRGVAL